MSNQQLTPRVTAAGSGIGRASGFELASPGQPGAANVEAALERNRAFAAAGGHEGAVVFPNLRLFVITCLDPRVDPAHFLGLDLSDAMVVRNVGGRVTPEVINDVAFIGQLAENVTARRPAVRGRRDPPHPVRNRRARRRHLPPPLRRADRRRRVDPARARRPRPRGDRHPRRRAPPLRARDLPARHRVRARLRRRHGPGADGHRRH